MNDKIVELLKEYSADFIKMNIEAEECKDYCGQIGLIGLQDEQIRLKHARWMIDEMLSGLEYEKEKWDYFKTARWLGFLQSILWCTKFRGILKLNEESENIYGE